MTPPGRSLGPLSDSRIRAASSSPVVGHLGVVDQDHELVTAEPGDQVGRAHAGQQPARDLPQCGVAGRVAQACR